LIGFLSSCDESEKKEILTYDGPLREVENIEYYNSEHGKVSVKMTADLVYEFVNGDREFPKGVSIEFYDEFGKISSTLKANQAFFFKEENKWRGQGNVEVKNILQNEQLNTEELFWNPKDQKIYTDKFVTIRQQSNVIYGEGLDAKQDLSSYKILNLNDSDLHFEE
jgi:LPS export ABC transporter protein LptC